MKREKLIITLGVLGIFSMFVGIILIAVNEEPKTYTITETNGYGDSTVHVLPLGARLLTEQEKFRLEQRKLERQRKRKSL